MQLTMRHFNSLPEIRTGQMHTELITQAGARLPILVLR